MVEVRQTATFTRWMHDLRDEVARTKIAVRLRRLALGNPGDTRSVGGAVSELRIDHGPGYRVYFTQRGNTVVILLCGGDKRTQDRDIKRAHKLDAEID